MENNASLQELLAAEKTKREALQAALFAGAEALTATQAALAEAQKNAFTPDSIAAINAERTALGLAVES